MAILWNIILVDWLSPIHKALVEIQIELILMMSYAYEPDIENIIHVRGNGRRDKYYYR